MANTPQEQLHAVGTEPARKSASGSAGIIQAGTSAPAFTLHTTPDQTVSLADFQGQPVILAFYPADWSPVCGDQMTLYNEILPEFRRHRAMLLGISVDGVWCHGAFAGARKLHFPLLADFEPKGDVARTYGAYRAAEGVAERALVRDRWRRRHAVELPLADRRQSRGGRHPRGARVARGAAAPRLEEDTWPSVSLASRARSRSASAITWSARRRPTTLVEYGDYSVRTAGSPTRSSRRCCGTSAERLRFAFRHFPLAEIHPYALRAAEAAEAAGAQGKFWPMHDLLFANQQALDDAGLVRYATHLGLDVPRFVRELAEHTWEPRVREDFMTRRAQRGERHADVLRQRDPARRAVGRGDADRGAHGDSWRSCVVSRALLLRR